MFATPIYDMNYMSSTFEPNLLVDNNLVLVTWETLEDLTICPNPPRMAQPVDVTAPAPREVPKQREQLEQKLNLGEVLWIVPVLG